MNAVVCADALEWLAGLEAGSIDVFWSSPPYNLADALRVGGRVRGRVTQEKWRYPAGHQGDGSLRPEPEYQREQVTVLTEWHRCLRDDGVAFYNHKVRIKEGRSISPLEWLLRTPFVLLQELVWDRGLTQNVDDHRFLPVSERVYVLTKRAGLRLTNRFRTHDVLRIPPYYQKSRSGHPCPSHPEVVRRCLEVVPRPVGRRVVVADCYAGTGTTGLVARSLGMDYLLCDHAPAYVELMERNLGRPMQPALIA